MFGGAELSELEPVRQALAQGRYEAAFALLERAARRPRRRRTRALYRLHLAALYALYGYDGVEEGTVALRSAVEIDSGLEQLPLYSALYWEFGALAGEEADKVRSGLETVREEADGESLYHAASALYIAGALQDALEILATVGDAELPGYLRWRRWSLSGLAEEELGNLIAAAASFEQSVLLATGTDQQLERLTLAGCLLELHRGEDALAVLRSVDEEQLELADDVMHHRYLAGRAELERGNPNLALDYLEEARELADGEAESFSLLLAEGQALTSLGRFPEAVAIFERAAHASPDGQRSYALHELALAQVESGEFDLALEGLEEATNDDDYPYRAEARADLAEIQLKLGNFDQAELLAQQALEDGATAQACLTLGSIAYEYYRLDEAVTWFERAASASEAGEPIWVLSQQLLADVFAQKGPQVAERLATHARAALRYVDPANEWYLPLKEYLDQAEQLLGGHGRVLN